MVACVPTDVVWEGDGSGEWASGSGGSGPARVTSSWSWEGRPLPYVPVIAYREDAGYRTNTDRYDRSRAEHPRDAAAAVIPLETAEARVLLIAGGRDEVWASGRMTEALLARYLAAGRADRAEVRIYPTAGHMICGDGSFPGRLYNTQRSEPWAKDVTAEGEASRDAWRAQIAFLRRVLGR